MLWDQTSRGALFQYQDCLSRYRDSHYQDKMAVILSYHYDENLSNPQTVSKHAKDLYTCIMKYIHHMDGLVQDCSISSALALEILLSCT